MEAQTYAFYDEKRNQQRSSSFLTKTGIRGSVPDCLQAHPKILSQVLCYYNFCTRLLIQV